MEYIWIVYIVIVVICAVFSAFFSATDLAYGMVDQDRLKKASEEGNKKATLALKIAQDYEWSISSILFGNNVVNIIASSFVTLLGVFLGIEAWISFAFGAFIIVIIKVGDIVLRVFDLFPIAEPEHFIANRACS